MTLSYYQPVLKKGFPDTFTVFYTIRFSRMIDLTAQAQTGSLCLHKYFMNKQYQTSLNRSGSGYFPTMRAAIRL